MCKKKCDCESNAKNSEKMAYIVTTLLQFISLIEIVRNCIVKSIYIGMFRATLHDTISPILQQLRGQKKYWNVNNAN